jgi:hypothetical protein
MILNGFAILDFFVVGLRLLAAAAIIVIGASLLRTLTRLPSNVDVHENRSYLLVLGTGLLLVLNFASWPLFYLLLQSYIPQWPGVMCIYGVTRIGEGSQGSSRFLPDLIVILQVLKPLVVFCSGLWLVLYFINRGTKSGSLLSKVVATQCALGLVSLADSAAEITYLLIPKQEQFLSVGCCTAPLNEGPASTRLGILPPSAESLRGALLPVYLLVNVALIAAAWIASRGSTDWSTTKLVGLFALATVAVVVGAVFMVEVVAPSVLHLPFHRCPYDLVPKAPDIIAGAMLGVGGFLSVGWALAASLLAPAAVVGSAAIQVQQRLLGAAAKCYVASLLIISVGLALA